jgi:CubicO group peptidase (beta-lactamase class C family)
VTGKPYADYVESNVLELLGMADTGFEAAEFGERLAVPYELVRDRLRELPRTGWNASGKMRSTALDLAQFLAVHMSSGARGDIRILRPETVALMHELVSPLNWRAFFGLHWEGYGMGWEHYSDGFEGHPGACPGYLGNLVMRPEGEGGIGVVLLVNRGASIDSVDWAEEYYAPILRLLLDEAGETYRAQGAQ